MMAETVPSQQRLDRITSSVAAELVAEVCSIYVMRAGEVLELFATLGLNPSAKRLTRLRTGEGLVGEVAASAAPLAVAEAWSHPSFVFRPETGEEDLRSFLGVPIRRGGNVLGVVTIQNRTPRVYSEDEIETLEIVAMVLAEILAVGDLIDISETKLAEPLAREPGRIGGTRITQGVVIGRAVLHRPQIIVHQLLAHDPDADLRRFDEAMLELQRALDRMVIDSQDKTTEFQEIIETYRMFAEDSGWRQRITDAIKSGLTAEAAVQKTQNDTRQRMRAITDPYLRERLNDFEDLTNRVLLILQQNFSQPAPHRTEPNPSKQSSAQNRNLSDEDYSEFNTDEKEIVTKILVARNMGVVELLNYQADNLDGLVLEEGSATSHLAIVARTMNIPVICRVKDVLTRLEAGDVVIMDGENAQIFIRPTDEILSRYRQILRERQAKTQGFDELRQAPAITQDGVEIELLINAGMLADAIEGTQVGCDGIGLYRTELEFMARRNFPDLATQTANYRQIIQQMAGKKVTFRTLDVGGDKILPYFPLPVDENPAMGWRAIRVSLDRPALLRRQLRALTQAAAGGTLSVMFPMIALTGELRRARAYLEDALAAMAQSGQSPPRMRVGTMLEVPSLLWQIDQLAGWVDFISVGSNDLAQFFFAADRGSTNVAERYDQLSGAFLRALRQVVQQCAALRIELSVCGEMAGDPLAAAALMGIGVRSLSMSPAAILPIKQMIRDLDLAEISDLVNFWIERENGSLRRIFRQALG